MKAVLKIVILGLALLVLPGSIMAKNIINMPTSKDKQAQMTPEKSLSYLKEGNKRFVADAEHHYNYVSIRQHNAQGQHPFAVVLSCIDSRSIPDVLFDQSPGNLFVARIAGNVINADVLGSMEFATKYAGSKLVVVMGHTSCGAVQGACKIVGEDNLRVLLNEIQPAVTEFKRQKNNQKICESSDYINAIARINVKFQMAKLLRNSATLRELINDKKIMLVGAMHDLATGKVVFLDINNNAI